MTPALSLPRPDDYFRAQDRLRETYRVLDPEEPTDGDILRRSAAMLELMVLAVCLLEILRESGGRIHRNQAQYYRAEILRRCGLDLSLIPQAAEDMGIEVTTLPTEMEIPSAEIVLRDVQSLLAALPIQQLERLGVQTGQERDAYRCRFAFEALRAYAFRNDPATSTKLRVIGQAYAKGLMNIEEAAMFLNVSVPDALVQLESCGHQRPLETIQLHDEERAQLLAAVRADRLARGGQPKFSRDLLFRDVVASERIEDVDARQWLKDLH